MKLLIPIDKAIAIRRRAGVTITFINKSANSVYYATEEAQLDTVPAGVAPSGGTPLAAGDQLQWPNFPGTVWFRAAVAGTLLDVLP